jgi:large subunit ribosomal protein L30
MARLKITLVKGLVGTTQRQRGTVASLGLRTIRQSVERDNSPSLQGVLRAIGHLVKVEEVK